MVAFYKCDNCGFKMKPGEMERLKLKYNDVGVEVIHSWKGTWNAGHVCHRCIKKAVKHGLTVAQ